MPVLKPSASDFTALVKTAAQYVPAGRGGKASKSGRGEMLAPPSLGAIARASLVAIRANPGSTVLTLPYIIPIPPIVVPVFSPLSISGCIAWLDGSDNTTMNSTTAVTQWRDKSGRSNTMTGTGTWSGTTMVFNGSTNAFSNTGFVFPASSYSLFAVYSNTTAPASTAYMNVAYGSNGFPMVGVYDSNQYVSARSVVGNTGALTTSAPGGWAAQTASDGNDNWRTVYADSNGNVYVNGDYGVSSTTVVLKNADGSTGATLPPASRSGMIAKYSPTGSLIWAAAPSQAGGGSDVYGFCIITDPSNNVFISSQQYQTTVVSNATSIGGASVTVPSSGADLFVAKYTSTGTALWAAQVTTSNGSAQISPRAIATDSSGNVAVCGEMYGGPAYVNSVVGSGGSTITFPFSATTSDGWVAKYSSTGIALWGARITSGNTVYITRIASDSIGNTYVAPNGTNTTTTFHSAPAVGGSMSLSGSAFLVKYSPNGTVLWAVALPSIYYYIGTDSSNNVFVAYQYSSGTTTVYNATLAAGGGGSAAVTLPFAGGTSDVALVKYSSSGTVLWAAGLGSSGNDGVGPISTDSNGNVLVLAGWPSAATINNATTIGGSISVPTGAYIVKYSSSGTVLSVNKTTSGAISFIDSIGNGYIAYQFNSATLSLSNSDGTTAATITKIVGNYDCFVAKYSPAGFITASPVPANSNTMVSSIYPSSTAMASFTNGTPMTALSGTVAATTGLYLGGPSNYFNGTLSELLVFSNALTSTERQRIEGYLANKWSTQASLPSDHPYKSVAPTP